MGEAKRRKAAAAAGIAIAVLAALCQPATSGSAGVLDERASGQGGAVLIGHPRIVDGDTVAFGRERVRLLGIDAPERDQRCDGRPCGVEATEALRAAVAGRIVRCPVEGRDRYGRVLATCYAGGRDLNAWMVRQGQARAAYGDQYKTEERAARRERVGQWRGQFEQPCRHRGTC